MNKIQSAFIAYRHTGEDRRILEPILSSVRDELARLGVMAYCTFFDEDEFQNKGMGARQIMEHAFLTIEAKDLLFVVQASTKKSEGMLMEVGRFFGAKPMIVARRTTVDSTYVPEMADVTYDWSTLEELVAGIEPALTRLTSKS